jgi:hypothetical protein
MLSSFDEITLLFETTHQNFRPRYVVLAIAELSRTKTIKRLEQHYHHFDALSRGLGNIVECCPAF